MGKYTTYTRRPPKPRNRGVHPVMRGIGCIMIVVVPILAYGASVILVNLARARNWPMPPDWYGPPTIHPILWKIQGLTSALRFLQTQNNLEANLVFTAIITVVIGGIMSIVYGYIYSLFGPPQYGPQDAPPIRKKVKAYKR